MMGYTHFSISINPTSTGGAQNSPWLPCGGAALYLMPVPSTTKTALLSSLSVPGAGCYGRGRLPWWARTTLQMSSSRAAPSWGGGWKEYEEREIEERGGEEGNGRERKQRGTPSFS